MTINLKCEKCGTNYTKPAEFVEWNNAKPNVFYKWSLQFCDTCRREKEEEALRLLPEVLKALENK